MSTMILEKIPIKKGMKIFLFIIFVSNFMCFFIRFDYYCFDPNIACFQDKMVVISAMVLF